MLPLHPWYPTRSSYARDTQKQAGGVVPCRHPAQSSCAWDTPTRSPLQAGPPHATSSGARRADLSTHALSVRTPTPARPRPAYRCRSNRSPTTAGSSHRCFSARSPTTAGSSYRRLFGPRTGATSTLMPVPPRPSCRYPLDPPYRQSNFTRHETFPPSRTYSR